MPMHLLLSGSGFFAVGRIVPRLQRIGGGVQILQDDDRAGGIYRQFVVNPSKAGDEVVGNDLRKKSLARVEEDQRGVA